MAIVFPLPAQEMNNKKGEGGEDSKAKVISTPHRCELREAIGLRIPSPL